MKPTLINPFEKCELDNYSVDGEVVAELARIGASGDAVTSKVGVTYLRVLVARAQHHLGGLSGYDPPTQAAALDASHRGYYPFVLNGITTADCADSNHLDKAERSRRSLERNRRSNFARTAASTVRTWISCGGQLQDINATLVTKAFLIGEISAYRARMLDAGTSYAEDADPSSTVPLNDAERALARTFKRMVRGLSQIKATSPERAAALAARITTSITTQYGAK